MSIRTVQPGEKGCDFSYTKPPPQLLIDLGYTFCAGYSSYNTEGKNCDNPSIYVDAGLAYIDLWEVAQTSANGGYSVGVKHGHDAAQSAQRKGVPAGVAIVACSDTNTTPANIVQQTRYMDAFWRNESPYELGIYDDTDLAAVVPNWKLGILPSAWAWSKPSKAQAEFRAQILGYHILQHNSMYLPNTLYRVDPLVCVKAFQAWGKPTTPTPQPPTGAADMDQYRILVSDTFPTGGYSVYVHDINAGTKRAIGLPEWDALGYPDAIPAVRVCNAADLAAIPDWTPTKPVEVTLTMPTMNLTMQASGIIHP